MHKYGAAVPSTVNKLNTSLQFSQQVKVFSIKSKDVKINKSFSRIE